MKKLIASAFGAFAVVFGASAQYNNATLTGVEAKADLKKPATIEKVTTDQLNGGNLNFGQIVISESAATVALVPTVDGTDNAAITATPTGCTLLTGIAKSSAAFKITGVKNSAYTISCSAASLNNGTTTLTVDTWKTSLASNAMTGNLGTSTEKTLFLGGTLNIPANATQGAYTGTFDVTVQYQ
jgi:transcription elongation factor